MSIADKLRAARRIEIKIEEITFSGSRVTPEQLTRYVSQHATDAEICRIHIDNVEGAKDCDLFEGAPKTAWKYNREDFNESIGDKPEWYQPLVKDLISAAKERLLKRTENEKK